MNRSLFRRAAATILSAAVTVAAPGLAPYAAAQNALRGVPVQARGVRVALPASAVKTLGAAPKFAPSNLVLSPSSLAPAAAAARPAVAAAAPAAVAGAAAVAAETLTQLGPVASAPAGAASEAGRRLETVLSGDALASRRSGALASPVAASFGALAGRPSLGLAAASADGKGPTPPSPRSDGPVSKGPLVPRVVAALIALLPAYFLGLPLLAAAPVLGGLTIASSALLALLPLFGPSLPKAARTAPGVAVAALGVLALPGAAGVVTAIAGWGLARFGADPKLRKWDTVETAFAVFGGIAATAAVGLSLVGPAGWLGTAAAGGAYLLTVGLWPQLPKFVWSGVTAGGRVLAESGEGAFRVVKALKRDTIVRERFERFTKRMGEWKPNYVWLGILWGGLYLVEAVYHVAGAASALATGLVQVPVSVVWGAIEELWPESKAHVFAAEWGRFAFQNVSNGKARWFNKAEKVLLGAVNSGKVTRALPGSIAFRALQLVWLAASPIAAAVLGVAGVFVGLARMGTKYDGSLHLHSSLDVETNDRFEKPTLDEEPAPGGVPFAARLFIGGVALTPALYFGWPLLAGYSILKLGLFLGAALPLVRMAYQGPSKMTGTMLTWNGAALVLSGHAPIVGLAAWLGGWGLKRLVKELQETKQPIDEMDIAAFFGALAAVIGVGAAWTGAAGLVGAASFWLALGASPLLLQHLPRWIFEGVGQVFVGAWESGKAWHKGLDVWTKPLFSRAWGDHFGYWTDKHWTNAFWTWPMPLVVFFNQAADGVLAAALGLVTGVIRAPISFLSGAFENSKRTAAARFFEAFQKGSSGFAEDSGWLASRTKGLRAAMNGTHPKSKRPTAKATGAFVLLRLAQVVWAAGALLANLSGATYVAGLIAGVKAVRQYKSGPRLYYASTSVSLSASHKAEEGGEALRAKAKTALEAHLGQIMKALDAAQVPHDKAKFKLEHYPDFGVTLDGKYDHMAKVELFLELDGRQHNVARHYFSTLR